MKNEILDPPDYLPVALWEDFVAYRREEKTKKFTIRSQRMFLNKLERFRVEGYDPILLLESAMESEWLTVYKKEDCRYGANTESNKKQSAVERVREKAQATRRDNLYALGNFD
tara:strand:- start:13 stop:351 length:339 start_codon:yes stop_codon:yes gene_type:complete